MTTNSLPPQKTIEIGGQPVEVEEVTVKMLLMEMLEILRELRAIEEIRTQME